MDKIKEAEKTIVKTIKLKAPVARVWRALTDHIEFGKWFGVKIDGPFVEGEVSRGHITYPGYEHVIWESTIKEMVPEKLFSYQWHPYAVESGIDYSKETPTLVEFRLETNDEGTTLIVIESGFENIPPNRRSEAYRMNEGGWEAQIDNIRKHLSTQMNAATSFLKLVADRKVREAYERYIASGFVHHNQWFKSDRQSLMSGMEEAGKKNPDKKLEIKKVFEDGDIVITFSHVKQNADDLGAAVVHMFRFEGEKVAELWDLGQPISKDAVNELGVF